MKAPSSLSDAVSELHPRGLTTRDISVKDDVPVAINREPVEKLTQDTYEAWCKSDAAPRAVAHAILRPSVQAALTLRNIAPIDSTSLDVLMALINELSDQCNKASNGDLERGEAMLMAQAHTLDAIFNRLVVRAAMNQGEYLEAADRYYRLALRAQNQCRATLETLATIKNPPNLAIVKQANIGQAVQVNNGVPASRAPENENAPNKLLEVTDGKRLDVGAASPASRADSELEAVGALDRAKDVKRESSAFRRMRGKAVLGRCCAHWQRRCASKAIRSKNADPPEDARCASPMLARPLSVPEAVLHGGKPPRFDEHGTPHSNTAGAPKPNSHSPMMYLRRPLVSYRY